MTRPSSDPRERFEQLVATLRHELITPLTVIGTALKLARDRAGELPEDVATALMAAARQHEIARGLLDDLGAVHEHDLALDLAVVDLREVTRQFVDDVQETLLARDAEVELPDEPVLVELDVPRFGQVLRNLLENASKYSPPQEPVRVHVNRTDDHAEVWVVDSGEGVTPEDAERIFDLYQQGDPSHIGLGIGLSVSRRIARAHGGDLHVTPAPEGPGSRFVIELPLHD